MAITIETQQKLNTYLLERHPGQLYDTYYRSIEEYINGPVYRTLTTALNDLIIPYATPRGLDSWQFFYTTRPGDMSYIKWAELLILLNKTTREGPTFNNIRALLRFFDTTADISLISSLALLSETSAFTVGTPVPPYNQRAEYIHISEDSQFKINTNDPPEFIPRSTNSLYYETTSLNISSENYRLFLKELLTQVLPANVRVILRFATLIDSYTNGYNSADPSAEKTVHRSQDFTVWTSASFPDKVVKLAPFCGIDPGIVVVTQVSNTSYNYYKLIGTQATALPMPAPASTLRPIYSNSFGEDHVFFSYFSGGIHRIVRRKVNNATTSDFKEITITTTSLPVCDVTVQEKYLWTRYSGTGSTYTVKRFDRDLNEVASTTFTDPDGSPDIIRPVNKDKAFTRHWGANKIKFMDYSQSSPTQYTWVVGSDLTGSWEGSPEAYYCADIRSFIAITSNVSNYYVYSLNGATGVKTLIATISKGIVNQGIQRAQVCDTTLVIFLLNGHIIKIANYLTSPLITTYTMPVGTQITMNSNLVQPRNDYVI